MHRSGTSCLAGTIQQAGLCLGDVSTNNKYNPKGNREHNTIMALNESLLKYNDASWNKPPNKEIQWDNSHLQQANEIKKQITDDCPSNCWGFKDPRTLLTFSFWLDTFPDSILIGTIRNPIDVAESLARRSDQFNIDDGLQLWLDYNSKLLDLLKKKPFPLVSFDYPSTTYTQKTNEIVSVLFPNSSMSNIDFFDSTLRSPSKKPLEIPHEIEDCYTELKTFLS